MPLRRASDFPTPAFRAVLPLLLIALLAIWDGIAIEKGWLYALVVAVVGVVLTPLVVRTRTPIGFAAATIALVVVAHFVAFLVWAPFVEWE